MSDKSRHHQSPHASLSGRRGGRGEHGGESEDKDHGPVSRRVSFDEKRSTRRPASDHGTSLTVRRASGEYSRVEPLRLENERLRALLQLGARLNRGGEPRHVLRRALDWTLSMGYRGGVGWLLQPDGERLMVVAVASGEADASLEDAVALTQWGFHRELGDNLMVRALFNRELLMGDSLGRILNPHVGETESLQLDAAFQVAAVAAVPIWHDNSPFGVLTLWTDRSQYDRDVVFLEQMARIVQQGVTLSLARMEAHRLEQASHLQGQALEVFFTHAANPVLLVDPIDGQILRGNSQAAAFLHQDPAELSGLNLMDLKIGEGADSAARMIYRIAEAGSLRLDDAAFRRKDGRVAFGMITARYLKPDANPFAVGQQDGVIVLQIRDTTERRAARGAIQQAYDRLNAYVEDLQRTSADVMRERERAEEANRLKSEFLANMSHELRTPMNAIIGFTSRVLKTAAERLDERETRNLNIVLRNADKLLMMINGLLDYAKLDANRMEINPELLQVVDLLEECAELTGELVSAKPIEIVVQCPRELTIETDRDKVRQILLNLMSNAVKFTEKGAITVSATRVEPSDAQQQPMLELAVSDTGIGIRKENLDLIFDDFRQVDGSYTRKEGGTGLGLAISAKLAELLGGRMSVSSTFGQGSTFTFHCPFEPPRRLVERGRRLRA